MVRRIDDYRYRLRFTPRRPGSIWSKLNITRVEKLLRIQDGQAGNGGFRVED
jgi:hypothetical protein